MFSHKYSMKGNKYWKDETLVREILDIFRRYPRNEINFAEMSRQSNISAKSISQWYYKWDKDHSYVPGKKFNKAVILSSSDHEVPYSSYPNTAYSTPYLPKTTYIPQEKCSTPNPSFEPFRLSPSVLERMNDRYSPPPVKTNNHYYKNNNYHLSPRYVSPEDTPEYESKARNTVKFVGGLCVWFILLVIIYEIAVNAFWHTINLIWIPILIAIVCYSFEKALDADGI